MRRPSPNRKSLCGVYSSARTPIPGVLFNGRHLCISPNQPCSGARSRYLVLAAITIPNLERHAIMQRKETAMAYLPETRVQLAQQADGIVGGVPGAPPRIDNVTFQKDVDKKVIRTAELSFVVTNVDEASAKLRALTLQAKGEIDQVREWSPSEDARQGELRLRVPADELEPVLKQLKGVAARVTNEQVSASDVTRQYADNAAHMRSLQAEEQQYLVILKQVKSVKDVLEVTEKLNEVRGQIEQLQTDINVMSHDIAMSAISIALTQNAPEGRVLGSWHPLLNARHSLRSMLASLGEWMDAMVSFLIYLPVVVLWALTIGGMGWVGWKIVRVIWRRRIPLRTAV